MTTSLGGVVNFTAKNAPIDNQNKNNQLAESVCRKPDKVSLDPPSSRPGAHPARSGRSRGWRVPMPRSVNAGLQQGLSAKKHLIYQEKWQWQTRQAKTWARRLASAARGAPRRDIRAARPQKHRQNTGHGRLFCFGFVFALEPLKDTLKKSSFPRRLESKRLILLDFSVGKHDFLNKSARP